MNTWKIATVLVVAALVFSACPSDVPDMPVVEMVTISGGTFTMGSPDTEESSEPRERPQHTVTLSSFSISKYKVTQAQWYAVMGTTIEEQQASVTPSSANYGRGDNYPMYYVSWYEAIEFCNRLSRTEGLTPYYTIKKTTDSDPNNTCSDDQLKWLVTRNTSANGYHLPTEAQWEYACRAGTTGPFNFSNGTGWGTSQITTDQANFNGAEGLYNDSPVGIYRERTTPVGTFAPNAWGLYDMHGNVFEWCWDWGNTYFSDPQTNPAGAVSSDEGRVIRGGSWVFYGQYLRSAYRGFCIPFGKADNIGFRLVRS